jgi:hypothetical protein
LEIPSPEELKSKVIIKSQIKLLTEKASSGYSALPMLA